MVGKRSGRNRRRYQMVSVVLLSGLLIGGCLCEEEESRDDVNAQLDASIRVYRDSCDDRAAGRRVGRDAELSEIKAETARIQRKTRECDLAAIEGDAIPVPGSSGGSTPAPAPTGEGTTTQTTTETTTTTTDQTTTTTTQPTTTTTTEPEPPAPSEGP